VNINDGILIDVPVGDASVTTHYYQAGTPTHGDIVLMHTGGAGVSAYMCWFLTFDALVDAGYRVTAPDAPGFGKSVVANDGSVKATDWLPAFMDALGIDQAHLIGNSMGGVTASHVAADRPERVRTLTLSGGEPRVATDAVKAIGSLGATPRNNFVRTMFAKPTLELNDVRRATADFVFDRDASVVDTVTRLRLDTMADPGAYARAKEGAMGQIARRGGDGGTDYLADIQAPTFLLHGRDEPWFYPDEHRPALTDAAMKAALVIPDCTMTFLPRCAHWPHLEHPTRYNALVLEFLANHDS
jgi:2-hydroxy-6-oxonona-2,4-dienedioate hydrolase